MCLSASPPHRPGPRLTLYGQSTILTSNVRRGGGPGGRKSVLVRGLIGGGRTYYSTIHSVQIQSISRSQLKAVQACCCNMAARCHQCAAAEAPEPVSGCWIVLHGVPGAPVEQRRSGAATAQRREPRRQRTAAWVQRADFWQRLAAREAAAAAELPCAPSAGD